MSYRLLNYTVPASDAPRAGLLVDGRVIDLKTAVDGLDAKTKASVTFDASSTLAVVQAWERAEAVVKAALAAKAPKSYALAEVKLAAPILYPTNIFCAAANYQDHFREMINRDVDKTTINPYFFLKVARQTVIGPNQQIRRPKVVNKLDWEAEIAVVIGKPARNVSAAQALDYIAGYTIINDLSARDYIRRADWPSLMSDWMWQKSFDTSAPMGPWITPKSEIADPQNLKINTWVNGNLEQDTHSKWMVFTVREQIEALSQHVTLLPGDVIATGTGSGVGHPKGKYMNPGDKVKIEIEGLGTLENPIVAGE
jgi:2-keto-4-pentenoate hydratase/2-oxohepta-3-ene-1,7-dioic acid hydratase in catechol pathway